LSFNFLWLFAVVLPDCHRSWIGHHRIYRENWVPEKRERETLPRYGYVTLSRA
jgi:hypothetical protein